MCLGFDDFSLHSLLGTMLCLAWIKAKDGALLGDKACYSTKFPLVELKKHGMELCWEESYLILNLSYNRLLLKEEVVHVG